MEHNGHSHDHDLRNVNEKKALAIVLALTASFMVVEAFAGFYTGSLALLSDAAHMLTDVFAISIAYLAIWFSIKPPTSSKTFGFYRAEILAAFFNSLLLFAMSAGILYEAYERFLEPHAVKSVEMTIVAVIGLLVNIAAALILFKYRSGNLNVRGALYHVLSDALGSVGAITAGVIMIATKWYYADSIVSVVVALLIIRGAWVLFRESIHILLEGTPRDIDLVSVQNCLCAHNGVISVHDLHAWSLTQGYEALSAHVVVEDMFGSEKLIKELKDKLSAQFNITHVTLQIETEECAHSDGICYENSVT